jgi:hypothetical protein
MRSISAVVAALFAALVGGCDKPPPGPSHGTAAGDNGASSTAVSGTAVASKITFTEVARSSGLDFVHHSGATGDFLFPEIMGGGAGFLDFDGDGLLDAYLVNSGRLGGTAGQRVDAKHWNRLYRNLGNG